MTQNTIFKNVRIIIISKNITDDMVMSRRRKIEWVLFDASFSFFPCDLVARLLTCVHVGDFFLFLCIVGELDIRVEITGNSARCACESQAFYLHI